ncbi:hypothetical protein SAMN05443247_07908 [Bradyrhizobium erythrophlei]|nr:hypothetical protein SAMN05443247_07908 [Bradyrhizobium erythrophlei]
MAGLASVGHALLIGRAACLQIAKANKPVGSRYNRAMGQWLRENELDEIASQERYRAILCLENLDPFEAWRAGLGDAQRRKLNHPSGVWQHWRRSIKPPAPLRRRSDVEDISLHDRVTAAAERARRGKPVYWSQEALRRAHTAMLDSRSSDLLTLARVALQGAIRSEIDLLELLEPKPPMASIKATSSRELSPA